MPCKSLYVSNAILWGAAVVCSALVGAPVLLTVVFLPVLALYSLKSIRDGTRPGTAPPAP